MTSFEWEERQDESYGNLRGALRGSVADANVMHGNPSTDVSCRFIDNALNTPWENCRFLMKLNDSIHLQ